MHEDLKWVLGLLFIFGVIWFAGGNLHKPNSQKPFIKPLTAEGGGQTYGADILKVKSAGTNQKPATQELEQQIKEAGTQAETLQKKLQKIEGEKAASPFKGKISISTVNRNYNGDPSFEYVLLTASANNEEPLLISGLRLQSSTTGQGADIGKGAYLPLQGEINVEQPIYLSAGEQAYITTGRSPLGMSFRLNECSGFFNQYQNFSPNLPRDCPAPQNDVPQNVWRTFNDQCVDYVQGLGACLVYPNPPANLSPECRTYVAKEISYQKCLDKHKNDSNFYKKEWRVFLGRDNSLWKSRREFVNLTDQSGKIIDTYTY